MYKWDCPEAVYRQHDVDDYTGKCRWCGRLLDKPARNNWTARKDKDWKSRLELAYRYFYDPDFGNDKRDIY